MKYVILGGGPAGIFAAEAIRRKDAASPVLLITREEETARSPVMLTYRIGGEIPPEGARFRDISWAEVNRIDLRLRQKAVALQPSSRKLILGKGEEVPYDRLLIATGSSPVYLPLPGADLKGVRSVRHAQDAEAVQSAIPGIQEALIIGGGFIGLKLAEHLKRRGIGVRILEKENRLAPRMFDDQASLFVKSLLARAGIRVETGVEAGEIEGRAGQVHSVKLKDGRTFPAQMVIQSVGVKPNIDFLAGSGIALGRGIPVDMYMETNIGGVYAAGDVALTLDSVTGERVNNFTWPAACRQGPVAGTNMAGGKVSYIQNVPLNAFRLCGIPILAAGNPTGAGKEVLEEEGPDFYRKILLHEGKMTGFILMGDVCQAGELLASLKKREILSPADLYRKSSLRARRLPPGAGYGHGSLFPKEEEKEHGSALS